MRRTWISRFAGHAVEKWRDRAEQITFAGFELGEMEGEPGVAAPAVLVEHRPGLVGESDDDLAAVGLVGGPGDESGILEAVDGPRHRRWLDLLDRRQLADGEVAVPGQGAESRQLGERQIAAAALEAQATGEPHHANAQRRDQLVIDVVAGQHGCGHILSIAHYPCETTVVRSARRLSARSAAHTGRRMFENLSNRLDGIVKRLRGKGRLTEADVDEILREIRAALLDADVNVGVTRDVVERIRAEAIGATRSQVLDPGQQVVKIVNGELTRILGGEALKITYASRPPTVVLMAGLQGSGKTTAAAKLARWFKAQGRNPLLVGADLQRPAAVEQLRTLGNRIDVPVFSEPDDPVITSARGLAEARRLGRDVCIVDTAGRLAIDAEMMEQVRLISGAVAPHYTFLVIDAMTGQDAVNTAVAFNDTLAIDGVILSKLDGDARGGAALSVKEVIGKPIAFASTGEKLDAFEQFHPDRMAGRILGMGDMLTLIEQAEQAFEKEQAEEAATKLLEGQFTLDDFLAQMQQLKKMGPLGGLLKMMPGMPKELKDTEVDDDALRPVEAIIRSMTPDERVTPQIINGSRRNRIALGSGTSPSDVNRLIKQFSEMQKMMKRFGGLGTKGKRGGRLGALAGMRGGAMPDLSELGDLGALGDLPGLPKR